MNQISKTLVATCCLMMAALGGWACNDDDGDSLTVEEYFQQLDEIDNSTDAEISANFEGITDESDVAQFQDATKEIGPILEQAAEDVAAIDPPEEIQEEHDALLQELEEWADTATAAANSDAAAAATTPDELFAALNEEGFEEGEEEFSVACNNLEQVAADNEITVDLGCDDEEES